MAVYLDNRGRYFIQFLYKGVRFKERLPVGTSRKQAEEIEVKRRNDILMQSHGMASHSTLTFEKFVDQYFAPHAKAKYSKDSYEKAQYICSAARPFFKGMAMNQIKAADLERFQDWRASLPTKHKKPRKPATVAREMSILSKIFSLAVKNDVCEYNPYTRVDKPKFDNVMDKVLRVEDEEAFFKAFRSDWCKDVCLMALYTGLSQKDILKLTKFNVDLQDGIIRLTRSKTGRKVDVMIEDKIRPMIEERYARKSVLMFPSPKTGDIATQTKTAIIGACKRAGIERLTIRDLRRTCGSRLEELGINSGTVAKYLGHADLRSVQRYQRSRKAVREAAKALQNEVRSTVVTPGQKLTKVK